MDPLSDPGAMRSVGGWGSLVATNISIEGKHVLDNSGSLPHFGGLTHDHTSSNIGSLRLDLGGDEASHAPSMHRADNSLHDASKMQVSVGGTVYLGGEIIVTATGASLNGVAVSQLKPEDFIDGGKFLGRGVSGSVRRMIHRPTGQRIAVKEIALGKSEIAMQNVKRELRTLFVAKQRGTSSSQQQAVVKGAAYLIDSLGAWAHEGSVFIAMECMDGSLGQHNLPACPEPVAAKITAMVLRGLRFLHEDALLVHRDIKPGNLLFRMDGTIKITDFGLSSQLNEGSTQTSSFVGSVMYMSPERVRGEMYSLSSDVWSLGVTIAEVVLNYHPFRDAMGSAFREGHQMKFWKLVELYADGCSALHRALRQIPGLSPSFLDFLLQCLQSDEATRATCRDLLKHPWITSHTRSPAIQVVSPKITKNSAGLQSFQAYAGEDDDDGFSDDDDVGETQDDAWKSMDEDQAASLASTGTVYNAAARPVVTGDEEVAAWFASFSASNSGLGRSVSSHVAASSHLSAAGPQFASNASSGMTHLQPPRVHLNV